MTTSKRFRKPKSNILGQRFGKLTVKEWSGDSRWICLCDCGNQTSVLTANLKRGNTSSCGCIRNLKASKRATKHGLSNTIVYKTWLGIRRRCRDKKFSSYPTYGGLGIDIHQEWYENVETFVRDVGHPPTPDHTIDRIDNKKGYEPGNVRWATAIQQARNRTSCRPVQFQGETFPSISAFIEWLAPQIKTKQSSLKKELSKL